MDLTRCQKSKKTQNGQMSLTAIMNGTAELVACCEICGPDFTVAACGAGSSSTLDCESSLCNEILKLYFGLYVNLWSQNFNLNDASCVGKLKFPVS